VSARKLAAKVGRVLVFDLGRRLLLDLVLDSLLDVGTLVRLVSDLANEKLLRRLLED
jgi:hypothetical protein